MKVKVIAAKLPIPPVIGVCVHILRVVQIYPVFHLCYRPSYSLDTREVAPIRKIVSSQSDVALYVGYFINYFNFTLFFSTVVLVRLLWNSRKRKPVLGEVSGINYSNKTKLCDNFRFWVRQVGQVWVSQEQFWWTFSAFLLSKRFWLRNKICPCWHIPLKVILSPCDVTGVIKSRPLLSEYANFSRVSKSHFLQHRERYKVMVNI